MTTTDARPVLPADLGEFADIGEVALSPDGARVAVAVSRPDVASNRYARQVLAGPVEGTAPLEPVDPDAGGPVRLPRWSPADDRLAVVVDRPSGCEVRLVAPDGAVTTAVTGWPDPVEELAWSPDGRRLLFVVREPADRAWYELPEDRRPPRRLTTLGYREDGVGWTVDRPRQAYLVDAGGSARPPGCPSAGSTTPSSPGTPTGGPSSSSASGTRAPTGASSTTSSSSRWTGSRAGSPAPTSCTAHRCPRRTARWSR